MRSGRHLSSANPVTPRSGRKYHDTCQDTSYEEYQQAKKSIANHMKTMVHASRCKSDNCTPEDCFVMKIYIDHIRNVRLRHEEDVACAIL